MVRTQVYLIQEQARDIKLQAKREKKREAEVIRDLLNKGLDAAKSTNTSRETTGEALLRLAKLGAKLQVRAPADLSSRIDDYLYGDEQSERHDR